MCVYCILDFRGVENLDKEILCHFLETNDHPTICFTRGRALNLALKIDYLTLTFWHFSLKKNEMFLDSRLPPPFNFQKSTKSLNISRNGEIHLSVKHVFQQRHFNIITNIRRQTTDFFCAQCTCRSGYKCASTL